MGSTIRHPLGGWVAILATAIALALTPGSADAEPNQTSPSSILNSARVLPKYSEGRLVGVQVHGIKPDSLFERSGIQNGDTIVRFNGVAIDSPKRSAEFFRALGSGKATQMDVENGAGETRTVESPAAESP